MSVLLRPVQQCVHCDEPFRRGLDPKTPNVRISAALADFVQMGFFWRTESNGFELAPGAATRVAAN